MCICILKNDHACKYMGLPLTKEEDIQARQDNGTIQKYDVMSVDKVRYINVKAIPCRKDTGQ